MPQMGREFTLVLLGSGLLTAGYFGTPPDAAVAKSEEEAAKRVGATATSGRRYGGSHIFFVSTGGPAYTSRSVGTSVRSGWGSTGGSFGARAMS